MYGLIGSVLKHSYSREIHKAFGIDNYSLYELNEKELAEKVKKRDYKGLNITVPYKKQVMALLDQIDESALLIGAVNTVINSNGMLIGYNTDYYGFDYLMRKHGITVSGKKVLVLGNGGVAQVVFHYLHTHKVGEFFVVKNRPSDGAITYEEAKERCSDFDIIINTSPVGMYPNIYDSPMSLDGYNNLSAVIDLIANPQITRLLSEADEKGITAIGSLEMLVAQAKLAHELFRKVEIPEEKIEIVTQIISDLMKNQ